MLPEVHGATNWVHNIQEYVNKFLVHSMFLEAVKSFVHQYNILLSFVYWCCFLHWLKNTSSFDLNVWTLFNRSASVSTILIKFTWSPFLGTGFRWQILFLWTCKWINTYANTTDFIHWIYLDSKSNLDAAIWSWAILY